MNQEPVAITGFIGALLTVLISFGVPITPDQKIAILGLAGPVVILVGVILVRRKVTPTNSVLAKVTTALATAPAPTPEGIATQAKAIVNNG